MEEKSWKGCVPPPYWDSVTCYCMNDDRTKVYACINEGAFIACCNGIIERSCQLIGLRAKSIEPFLTYYPFKEYFLIRAEEKLVVISNTKDLKVIQTYEDIKSYEIGDYENQGYPQLKIWPVDVQKQALIVDVSEESSLTSKSSANVNDDYICTRLVPKLKEAKDLLMINAKELESKRKLRTETMMRLINKSSPDNLFPPAQVQCFMGDKVFGNSVSKDKLCTARVELLYPWQIIIDKQWLLGIAVKNSGSRAVAKLNVLLHMVQNNRIVYTVKRLYSENISEVFKRLTLQTKCLPPQPVTTWQEASLNDKLSPEEGCILIVVLPFPDFTETSIIAVNGQISYTVVNSESKEEVYSQYIPEYKITVRNLLDGSLSPKGLHKDFFETLSVIAVSEVVLLSVHLGLTPTESLEDILKRIGFTPIHEDNLFYHSGECNQALSRCIIQEIEVSKHALDIRLYARSFEELVVLVYLVLEAFPVSWEVKYAGEKCLLCENGEPCRVTVDQCSAVLSKEIMFLVSSLSNWKRKHCGNRICIEMNLYKKFRKILKSLQKETDRSFSILEKFMDKHDQKNFQ